MCIIIMYMWSYKIEMHQKKKKYVLGLPYKGKDTDMLKSKHLKEKYIIFRAVVTS